MRATEPSSLALRTPQVGELGADGGQAEHPAGLVCGGVGCPAIRGGASVMDDVFGEQASQTSSLAP
jgi:nicotinamide mononucleotide (NMN) deamidase PncC